MSCNISIPLQRIIDDVISALSGKYIATDNPYLNEAVLTATTFRGDITMDTEARNALCQIIQTCDITAEELEWLARPTAAGMVAVSGESGGEIVTTWQNLVAIIEQTITENKEDVRAEDVIVSASMSQADKNTELSNAIAGAKPDTQIVATAKFGGVDRTQADKNSDTKNSKDMGIIPNIPDDQSAKIVEFFGLSGDLTLEPGVYYMGTEPFNAMLKSNTNIQASGAILDFSDSTKNTTGYIKAYGADVLQAFTLSADAAKDSNNIRLNDASGISEGDILYIKSETVWSSDAKQAEIICVSMVDGNELTLTSTLQSKFAMLDTTVELRDIKSNITLEGITLIGSGRQLAAGGKNERGVQFNNVANCELRNVKTYNFDHTGIMLANAYNTNIRQCTVGLTKQKDGENYVQYCISLADAFNGGIVEGCVTNQGRHGVVYTTYSGYGYSVNHKVENNIISNTNNCGISTHKTNADLLTRGNIMNNCWGGIDIRVNKASCIGDKVYNPTYGVVLRGNVSDLNLKDMEVYNSFNAIYGAAELEGVNKNLKITNLVSKGSTNDAVKILMPADSSIEGLDIVSSTLKDTGGEGVSLTGDITDVLIDALITKGQLSTRYGVRLFGVTDATITNSTFTGRPVRAEANAAVVSSGIRVLNNTYTGDYTPLAAAGGTTDVLSRGNVRSDVSASLGIVDGTITTATGLGYGAVYASTDSTLTTISGSVSLGEVLRITKAGPGVLTIDGTGNITVPAGTIVLNDADTVVTLVYTGTKWVVV